jgi:hypothetical protein
MGVGIVTCFQPDVPSADSFAKGTDGNDLAGFVSVLDALAATKKLPPFSRFFPELDDIDFDEMDENDLPELDFDPSEGLRMISVFVGALRSFQSPSTHAAECSKRVLKLRMEWGDSFLELVENAVYCLELLAKDLEVAKQAGSRFWLAYT